MSVNTYRSAVERINKEITNLGTQIAREREQMNRANSEVARIMATITSSTPLSSVQSRQRDVLRKRTDASNYEKKVLDLEKRRATKTEELNRNLRSLESAAASEKRSQDQADKKRRDEENKHNKEITKEIQKQLNMHREIQKSSFSIDLTKLPDKITILFIGSNPQDQDYLSLDEEIRSIDRIIQASAHRDSIELKSSWAARPADLMQKLNELKPTIVHFSGHGNDEGNLVFQDEHSGSRFVSPEAIAATMATLSDHVQLVVYNACFSEAQALLVTNHVPAAIGMSQKIGDEAARVFATGFYSAIGFGYSLQTAFDQAKAFLMLEGIPEETTPQLIVAPDIDASELILVKPN